MKNIWRFFDKTHCISGIVISKSEEDAICYTKRYLVKQFTDITSEDSLDVCVWSIEDDDDFNHDFPYAVAINY